MPLKYAREILAWRNALYQSLRLSTVSIMHVDRPKLEIIEIEIMEGTAMACFYLEMLGTFGTRWTKDGENEPVCYRRAGLIALFAR